MKTLFITFGVLLVILTLISAFGGSLNHETFEEEPLPLDTQASSQDFWQEQQKALVESFLETQEQEPTTDAYVTPEHTQENFGSCGNYKEEFENAPEAEPQGFPEYETGLDIEPFEDEKTYGAF